MQKRCLVTGAGGSAGNNFIRCLRLAPEKIYIVGTDMNKYHLKLSAADKTYVVPSSNQAGYLYAINSIIRKEKITFEEAPKKVQQKRPTIHPNSGFRKQLVEYEKEVLEQQKN